VANRKGSDDSAPPTRTLKITEAGEHAVLPGFQLEVQSGPDQGARVASAAIGW
jgi:hypothetical protein